MGFVEWHGNLVKKVSASNLTLAVTGKAIVAVALGSMFAIELVRYGIFILPVAVVILVGYLSQNLTDWHKNRKTSYGSHLLGWVGALLLLLYFGIQSPQIPFKIPVLVIGILLVLPATKDWMR